MKIFQWNTLADSLCDIKAFPKVASQFLTWKHRSQLIEQIVHQHQCHVYCFQEVDHPEFFQSLLPDYHCLFHKKPANKDGIFIAYSKTLALQSVEIVPYIEENKISNQFFIKLQFNEFSLFVTHLKAKVPFEHVRQSQLLHLAKYLNQNKVIVCGDFNTQPHLEAVQSFLQVTKLQNVNSTEPTTSKNRGTLETNIKDYILYQGVKLINHQKVGSQVNCSHQIIFFLLLSLNYQMSIDNMCRKFLRPKRVEYQKHDLGPDRIQTTFGTVIKHEFETTNRQGHRLNCSFFEVPLTDCCIVYCHGFNGCRVEGVKYAHTAAKYGLNCCIFDFQACGMSEGELITFGHLEQGDISSIISDLKNKFRQNQFILWGRSLGATTIQLKKQPYISGYVLDSSFIDLNNASVRMIQKATSLPKIMIKGLMYLLRGKIEQQGNFKFDDIKIQGADSSVPTFYICSDSDTLIKSKNSVSLYQQHNGVKQLIKIEGEHNDSRSQILIDQICQWCQNRFTYESSPAEIRKKYQHLSGVVTRTPIDVLHKYSNNRNIKDQILSAKHISEIILRGSATKPFLMQEYSQPYTTQRETNTQIFYERKELFDQRKFCTQYYQSTQRRSYN